MAINRAAGSTGAAAPCPDSTGAAPGAAGAANGANH